MRLDHIVILVDDLDLASQDYSDLGFSVVPGGVHSDGLTQNALIAFADGFYMELLNFISPPPQGHLFAHGATSAEGIIAFALLPHNIAADVAAARRRGLHMHGPTAGGRTRPDGMQLEWQIGRADNPALPFMCADVTPRDLRVPYGPAQQHANHVSGVRDITVLVSDLNEASADYNALLGAEGQQVGQGAEYTIGPATLTLMQPATEVEQQHMRQHGPGPYVVSLLTRSGEERTLDPTRTHGVTFKLAKAGDQPAPTL